MRCLQAQSEFTCAKTPVAAAPSVRKLPLTSDLSGPVRGLNQCAPLVSTGPLGFGASQMIIAATNRQMAMTPNMLSVANMTLWPSTALESRALAVSGETPCDVMASRVA